MHRILTFYITLLLLFFGVTNESQAYERMRSITIHDGLAGESVYKIFKSHWGVMWIATSNGVTSYDGYLLKTYRVGEQRSKNKINDLSQSLDGFIWCATSDGIYKVDGSKQWLQRTYKEVSGNVSCIKIVNGRVFVGADDGLYIGRTDKKESEKHIWISKNHLGAYNKVNDLIVQGNKVWILSNSELYLYDIVTDKLHSLNLRSKLHINSQMRMMALEGGANGSRSSRSSGSLRGSRSLSGLSGLRGRLFIGTYNNGLYCLDLKTGKVLPYLDVDCRVITCLSIYKGLLYVGTDGSGLHVISLKDNKIVQSYTTSEDSRYQLRDNTVYAFYHDPSGVDFFGYFRQGVQHNYYQKHLFHLYKPGLPMFQSPGLSQNLSLYTPFFDSQGKNIRSICINGKVKVLGSRGGLWLVNEVNHTSKFFSPKELGGSIVTNVVEYAGQYYCCTFNGGVMRIDPKTLTTSRFGKSAALRESSFGCLTVSPQGELWMSGNAGVYIYNAKTDTERHFDSHNSQLPDAYCNNLLFDRLGRCWIGTAKGMCLYDPIDNSIHANGFPQGFFNQQHETVGAIGDEDNLLFYSLDGLFRTNEEMTKFGQITDAAPVSKQFISQVIYDKRQRNYWIATEDGMYRYDSKLKSVRKFGSETGLGTHEFSNGAIYIDDNNTLWTGTMHGLYYCDLKEAQNFRLDYAPIYLDDPHINLEPANNETVVKLLRQKVISLPFHWGAASFSFMPVLLNYSDQEELSFQYRVGKSGEWQLQEGHDRIQVEGLSVGHNILQVRLAGSRVYTNYDVYVFPNVWFIMEWILIVFLCFGGYIIYRQRKVALNQRQEMLRIQHELEATKRKYARVNVNQDEQYRLQKRLERYMEDEQPFLNTDLKMSEVAEYLDVSTVKLSQFFNVYLNTNYYDYVNKYRLEEFKHRLDDKKYANYTLLALAEECGFKRSSFFSTFKKVEGVTPTQYVAQQHAEGNR